MNTAQFSENLTNLRLERGLTIQLFAAACDVSLSAMHGYLYDGKFPTLETLMKICNALRISPNILLEGLFTSSELENIHRINFIVKDLSFEKRRLFDGVFSEYVKVVSGGPLSLIDVDLGERISILRKDTGFSVEEFANNCSVSRSTLAGIESGQKPPGTLVFLNICSALSVSPEFLLCNSLDYSSYPDERYKYLTLRQIDGLLKIASLFIN